MNNSNPKNIKYLPAKPGIYIYKDAAGKILYIGKAINIQKRVKSYFQKKSTIAPDKQVMVKKIKKIEYIITSNETEALLLETSLIKKHLPRFNIMLKDDKYFMYIKITTHEDFPRVFTVRSVENDTAKYFGPYTSALSVYGTLRLLKSLFPHRNFKSVASEKYINKMHLRYPELLGPQDQKEYQNTIDKIIKFMKGDYDNIKRDLTNKMELFSQQKKYEQAAKLRDKIMAINKISEKQKVVNTKLINQDVISLHQDNNISAINIFNIRMGKLINKENLIIQNTKYKISADIIQEFIKQYYPKIIHLPKELILPDHIEDKKILEQIFKFKINVPQKGKNKNLIKLGVENAKSYLEQKKASWEKVSLNIHKSLEQLKKSLGLKKIPQRIEIYDISNIQGIHAVGSMVVFTGGHPDKKWYRKFKIKTIKGANDPAMMAEILSRRFQHQTLSPSPHHGAGEGKEGWPKPDLIILDGGKSQLNTVLKDIKNNINIIALAKKHEEIYLPNHKNPINLKINSPAYFFVQRMRDEAHRFAITFYRQSHKKNNLASTLDAIPGIGPQTRKKLITQFGSATAVLTATRQELLKVTNKKITNNILHYAK